MQILSEKLRGFKYKYVLGAFPVHIYTIYYINKIKQIILQGITQLQPLPQYKYKNLKAPAYIRPYEHTKR